MNWNFKYLFEFLLALPRMIRNFEYLIVFTSTPGVLPEQHDRYRIQPWKVNEIKAYNYRFKSIFIDRNCLLAIIIDKKNYWFLPKCKKSRCGPLYRLRLPSLRKEGTLFSARLPIHYQTLLSFYLVCSVLRCI